jgi:hypothetical protein
MADHIFRLKITGESNGFVSLCRRFAALFAKKDGQVPPVWDLADGLTRFVNGSGTSLPEDLLNDAVARLKQEVEAAGAYLPIAYQEAFIAPLLTHINHLVRSDDNVESMHNMVEALAGAVVQHRPGHPVRQPLRQFLAVVSNLHRSFLSADKRISAGVPLASPALPPLVCFHADADFGPAVFASPMTKLLCDSDVAVVVMPSTYGRAPLAWLALAHEACGHGVLQADVNLLPDLVAGVRSLFGGGPLPAGATPTHEQALGLLWSYWVEETASDVYGLLNIGPAFALNLAAFLAGRRMGQQIKPFLEVRSGIDPSVDLDVHPTDLFRLHVAIGVIENLVGLSVRRITEYVKIIREIANVCGTNAWKLDGPNSKVVIRGRNVATARKVVIRGRVEIERDRWVPLELALEIDEAAESARRVGAYIASTRLGALGNRTIQDLETWDDSDEEIALAIRATLLATPLIHAAEVEKSEARNKIIDILGLDDAQTETLLAKLREDRFDNLSEEERIVLDLQQLDESAIAALRADRIEEIRDAGVMQVLGLGRIESLGDDGQLLAGAALAALSDSTDGAYRWINRRLASALNRSHRHDSIMGFAEIHHMFRGDTTYSQPPHEVETDTLEQAVDVGVGARPHAASAAADRRVDNALPEQDRKAKQPRRRARASFS